MQFNDTIFGSQSQNDAVDDVSTNLVKTAPLLTVMPVEASNMGSIHKYDQITGIKAGAKRQAGGFYKKNDYEYNSETMELVPRGYSHTIDRDRIKLLKQGGDSAIERELSRADKLVAQKTGNEIEEDFYSQLIAYAIANDGGKFGDEDLGVRVIDAKTAGGGTTDEYATAIFVTWGEEINGVFNPEYADGTDQVGGVLFSREILNGGDYSVIETNNDGDVKVGKTIIYDGNLDLKLNNPFLVTVVKNIRPDCDPAKVEKLFRDALTSSYPTLGRSTLLMHPAVANRTVKAMKQSSVQTSYSVLNIDNTVNDFEGSLVIESYNNVNFSSTEL